MQSSSSVGLLAVCWVAPSAVLWVASSVVVKVASRADQLDLWEVKMAVPSVFDLAASSAGLLAVSWVVPSAVLWGDPWAASTDVLWAAQLAEVRELQLAAQWAPWWERAAQPLGWSARE